MYAPLPPRRLPAARRVRLAAEAIAAAAAVCIWLDPRPASAATRTWTGGTFGLNSSWIDPNNWNPAAVPAAGDVVFIPRTSNSDTFITYNYAGPALTLASLTVSRSNVFGQSGNTTLSLPSGSLSSTAEYVGDTTAGGTSGSGIVNQTGGTNTTPTLILGRLAGNVGTYTLTGPSATLNTTTELRVGDAGRGFFTHSAGYSAASALYLGYAAGGTGTYSLSGTGSLSAAYEYAGAAGTGTFVQTGGSNSATTVLYVGYFPAAGGSGTYSLSNSASLTAAGEIIAYAGPGTFIQTGGTHTVSGPLTIGHKTSAANAYYSLSGTSLLSVGGDEVIANAGVATFDHAAGTHTVTGSLYLASSIGTSATYSLTGAAASLSTGGEYIGNFSSASFTQTAGTHTVSLGLFLGYNAGATGTYSLSGPASLSANTELIGEQGLGTLAQSAGVNSTTAVYLGHGTGGTGTYSLSGTASLVAGDIIVGHVSTGSFVQTGGTNTISGTLNLALKSAAVHGTYSLSGTGFLSAFNENIGSAGAASFTQSGGTNAITGTLTLAASAGSSASYVLSAGSLYAANTTINSNGTFRFNGGYASFGSLSLNGTGKLLLTAGGSQTLLASNLSIAPTTSLDLIDNRMLLNFAGPPTAPLTLLRQYLAAGQLTSATATADPNHRLALGYADTGFSQVLVKLTYLGDANLDGRVNADDYALIDRSYARSLTNAHWTDGDFNYDGVITSADYLLIDTTFGQAQGFSPQFLAQRQSQFGPTYVEELLASVPEPSSLFAACGLALPFITRRRSHSLRSNSIARPTPHHPRH